MTDATIDREHDEFLELFRHLLEAAPDPTLVVDREGRIVFANTATERTLGWSPKALTGEPVELLIPMRVRCEHIRHREQYTARPVMRAMGAGRELIALGADGAEIPVEISLNPIPGIRDMLTICVLRDISERKRAEQALRDLNAHLEERVIERTRELEAANRELEMLAYSIAHDLRAPLRAINGFSVQLMETLQNRVSQDVKRCLDIVASRASQMGSMIDDYLHLLAIGRKELTSEALDMQAVAQDVLVQLGVAPSSHITVGPMPMLAADPALMREVWMQLLRNAIKFSAQRQSPAIRATATEDERFVYFSVEDNGVGFDPAHAAKLFRLFERVHSARDFTGNGIGLCVVKRILERHGGGIRIEGALNEGARATFWLPKRPT